MTDGALTADGCYRWVVRLVGADGTSSRFASGSVLLDTTKPLPPDAAASGERVVQRRTNAVVWAAPRSAGGLTLTASGRDRGAGVVEHRFGTPTPGSGWSVSASSVTSDPASVTVSWTAGAGPARLEVTSVDALGHEGEPRVVELRVDRAAPRGARWYWPGSGYGQTSGHQPDLHFSAGTDAGSGLADLQPVQRQRRPLANGVCGGAWRNDGPAVMRGRYSEDVSAVSGWCYRWLLRPTDAVGNAGRSIASGNIRLDMAPPIGDFATPDEGSFAAGTATSFRVAWTEQEVDGVGPTSRVLERESAKPVPDGTCVGVAWRPDGFAVTKRSPSRQTGLAPGRCYRWRLNLADAAGNAATYVSGVVLVQAP
jgi:hypothetical protein